MSSYLEVHGMTAWLICLLIDLLILCWAWTARKSAMSGMIATASTIVLLTPMVYIGHPFIFAPLWVYMFEGLGATLVIIAIWTVLFFLFFGLKRLAKTKE